MQELSAGHPAQASESYRERKSGGGAGGKREEKESDLEREGQSDKEKSLAERLWEKERGRW